MSFPKVPVWLDCDPGHDDAFAILLAAYHPGIQLLGISTVFGNASIERTTRNASSILTAIGRRDLPVHRGAAKALRRPALPPPTDIHGDSGIDGTALLPAPLAPIIVAAGDDHGTDPAGPSAAIAAMAAALSAAPPGTAWIAAVGALTNVAALFAARPDLASHVAGVSTMAGAVGGRFTDAILGPPLDDGRGGWIDRIGNWTAWAEWNVLADPEAARDVLENEALRGRITMVPLDLTHQVLATAEARELLLWGPAGRGPEGAGGKLGEGRGRTTLRTMLVELLMFFAQHYNDVFNIPSPPLHDPLAVAAVLAGTEHEIAFHDGGAGAGPGPERFRVEVVTDGTHQEAAAGKTQTGRTVATLLRPGEPGVRIPRGLDVARFWAVLEECLDRADRANAEQDE